MDNTVPNNNHPNPVENSPANNTDQAVPPIALNLPIIPRAEVNFRELRRRNMVYVDKTDLIYEIAKPSQTRPVLLTHPRRFGKTLLCSTLECLFSEGVDNEYFQGLAIEQLWDRSEPQYEVIRLDLSCWELHSKDDVDQYWKRYVLSKINNLHDYIPFESTDSLGATALLASTVEAYYQSTGKQLVLILDEYDIICNDIIDQESEVLAQRRKWLANFFAMINSHKDCFRFVFITGVTNNQIGAGIFAGFDDLFDISFAPEYNNLLGFTEAEIDRYFGAYIKLGAPLCGLSAEQFHAKLRERYDGYVFSDEAGAQHIFNTWAIINCFYSLSNYIKKNPTVRSLATVGHCINAAKPKNADELIKQQRCRVRETFSDFWSQSGSISRFFREFFSLLYPRNFVAFLELISSSLADSFLLPKSLFSEIGTSSVDLVNFDALTWLKITLVQTGYYTLDDMYSQVQDTQSASQTWRFKVSCDDAYQSIKRSFVILVVQNAVKKFNLHPPVYNLDNSYFQPLLYPMVGGDINAVMLTINSYLRKTDRVLSETRLLEDERSIRNLLRLMLRYNTRGQYYQSLFDPVGYTCEASDDSGEVERNHLLDLETLALAFNNNQTCKEASTANDANANDLCALFLTYKGTQVIVGIAKALNQDQYESALKANLSQIKYSLTKAKDLSQQDMLCFSIVFCPEKKRAVCAACFEHHADGSDSPITGTEPQPSDQHQQSNQHPDKHPDKQPETP